MLLGLIFRESAKERRSITSWRAESKGILPQMTGANGPKRFKSTSSGSTPFLDRSLSTNEKSAGYGWSDLKSDHSFRSIDRQGYGFGRQGEKAAGLKGLSGLCYPDITCIV
jgi:hypothetical protein